MAQGYYTLEEASRLVGISPEELKQMARRGELRSFQDRGTWRFRVADIEELARRRGVRSDPDLVLGEAPPPRPTDSPAVPRQPPPAPKSPARGREGDVFDFSLEVDDENIGLGTEFATRAGDSKKQPKSKPPGSGPKSPVSGPRSPGPKSPARKADEGPKSPPPPAGSDSDVRLVADSNETFQLAPDSDIRPKGDSGRQPRSKTGAGPATPPRSDSKGKGGAATPPAPDSGVRLVPMESDSDVRLVGQGSDEGAVPLGAAPPPSGTDSDIRLERRSKLGGKPPSDSEGLLTDEIDLDAELKKQEEKRKPKVKARKPAPPPPPKASPFELSEPELEMPEPSAARAPGADSSDMELTPAGESPIEPSSSDFDLTPAGKSPIEPPSAEDDFRLELPDDDAIGLADLPPAGELKGPSSGIRLDNPQDAGISLEQGGEGSDEIEFNISLDAESTPRPGAPTQHHEATDSSSEFELTLDADSSPTDSSSEFELTLDSSPTDSSSEFELTLDAEPRSGSESDSEFELTLDDSGGLSPLEPAAPGDIFETEFEVPSLEEESGSEAVALETTDTDLESSDFDIAISDEDLAVEDESGSQVVAVEDEEADDAAATVAAPSRARRRAQPADEFEDLEGEPAEAVEEEVEPARTVIKERVLPPAPWGPVPALFLLPCVLILFAVTLMGYELVQSTAGHKGPGLLTRTIGGLLNDDIKKMK
jgi:excisionase family DNA binding protein